MAEAGKYPTWVKPSSGTFATLDDIRGYILAGTPADIVREPVPMKKRARTRSFMICAFATRIGWSI